MKASNFISETISCLHKTLKEIEDLKVLERDLLILTQPGVRQLVEDFPVPDRSFFERSG